MRQCALAKNKSAKLSEDFGMLCAPEEVSQHSSTPSSQMLDFLNHFFHTGEPVTLLSRFKSCIYLQLHLRVKRGRRNHVWKVRLRHELSRTFLLFHYSLQCSVFNVS